MCLSTRSGTAYLCSEINAKITNKFLDWLMTLMQTSLSIYTKYDSACSNNTIRKKSKKYKEEESNNEQKEEKSISKT